MHKLYSYLIKLSSTAAHVCMLLVETDIKTSSLRSSLQ